MLNGNTQNIPKRIKLLLAIDSLTGGGAEHVLSELANGLDKQTYEVHLLLTLKDINKWNVNPEVTVHFLGQTNLPATSQSITTRYTEKVIIMILWLRYGLLFNVPYAYFRKEVCNFILASRRFAYYAQSFKPGCILSFLPNTNIIALLAKRFFFLDSPILCSDRNLLSAETNQLPLSHLRNVCIKSFYPNATRHIAVSNSVAEDLLRNFSINNELIKTIPNGVDHKFLTQLSLKESTISLTTGNDLRLVAIGRFSKQKGFDILLDALILISDLPWELYLIGAGEEEQNLRNQARSAAISGKVHLLGWLSNPYPVMKQCDCLIIPSRWEGMPNVLLEGIALGLPVISSSCSGADEILATGGAGILVDAGSIAKLATAIRTFIQLSGSKRETMARYAYRRSLDYSFSNTLQNFDSLIRSQLS